MSESDDLPLDLPKAIFIIAGPNGAGKTTYAMRFLPEVMENPIFLNADEIARGLNPTAVQDVALEAGRRMLTRIGEHVERGDSFAFETTLSGRGYAKGIKTWRAAGYEVFLTFLCLPNAEAAKERVRLRVAQGGHNIPPDVIERRFSAGIKNFDALYKPLVSGWSLYDNSGAAPLLIEEG
ncbi:MAG: zeta toxin family protein [Alphaproteobacteria bacterium]|nr:zeta toxin family protein [Alphaproteobacteria bacterium]